MVLNTKDASYIIVLGLVISVLPISSTLFHDGYHVHFKQKQTTKQKRSEGNIVNLLETNVPNQSMFFAMVFLMTF
jgi:hypothetical protein